MDTVTQATAANAEESATAAVQLQRQADAMRQAIAELMGLMAGKAQSSSLPVEPCSPHPRALMLVPGSKPRQTAAKTKTATRPSTCLRPG
jgi:methyl-accepting chemotaxis protein